ncbi:glucosyl-3-phosphoglycerate synthase [Kineosporiaceae bacterium SCSIO 59966]|nr:glucosyl-3-phosphoglycerate synthase [Kineosporiaceae bacterium SCSIO 59966]
MDPRAAGWFERRTSTAGDWPLERCLRLRDETGTRVSVVVPARDEAATIGEVVGTLRRDVLDVGLVDELVVIDSDSTDDTAAVAAAAGAVVHASRDVAPELGTLSGKGEALWKSLLVTTGDVLVFVDADLTEWGPHFVTGLIGPLLADPGVRLVKGFYDRVLDDAAAPAGDGTGPAGGGPSTDGGRVTELVARPLLSLWWPHLAAVVQPLAGEWAVRRSLAVELPFPAGYGVELATLIDTVDRYGLDAVAQVDLGSRGHRHQAVHDLAVMAGELLAVADTRYPTPRGVPAEPVLHQYRRAEGGWRARPVPVAERPALREVLGC